MLIIPFFIIIILVVFSMLFLRVIVILFKVHEIVAPSLDIFEGFSFLHILLPGLNSLLVEGLKEVRFLLFFPISILLQLSDSTMFKQTFDLALILAHFLI